MWKLGFLKQAIGYIIVLFAVVVTITLAPAVSANAQAAQELGPNPFRILFPNGAPIGKQVEPPANVPAPRQTGSIIASEETPQGSFQVASFQRDMSGKVNRNTLGLIGGNPNGTYFAIAADISQVLDDGDNMRILPIVGKGGAQNIRDLLFLRGIDMAIIQSDSRNLFEEDDRFRPLLDNLRYITKLYDEELHIYARKSIKSLRDLEGKKVNLSDPGSGTNATMRRLFKDLNMNVDIVNMGQGDALHAMQEGTLDATVLFAGPPSGVFSQVTKDESFHFVPIPLTDIAGDHFVPAELTHSDYPGLVGEDNPIETVAVEAILVAYNWPEGHDRRRRLDQFVEALFNNIDKFRQAPRHPKWRDTNLAAIVPVWDRFPKAESLIERMTAERQEKKLEDDFKEYVRVREEQTGQTVTAQTNKEELFQDFLEWRENR
jgi:TRAP transporter TAXI family solute receptor